MLEFILIFIAIVVVVILISYVKSPPDTALIISGLRRQPKVLIGKAGLRIPFFERLDRIPLELLQIDVKTQQAVPTAEYIDVYIDGVANIKVAKDPDAIQKAAQHFLNMKPGDIAMIAKENLEGNLREIVGQMTLKSLIQERDKFAEKVKTNAAVDMGNMGFEIVNFTVQNIRDDHEAIRNLGVDNLEQIRKHALIARAQAEKEVKIEQARADETGNKARAEADANIAEQNKELALKRAAFKEEEDKAKAKANAAMSIEEQLQQKTINENEVAAEVAKEIQKITLAEKEASVKEMKLDAEVKKTADAEKYRMEKEAEAKLIQEQKNAEALKVKAEVRLYEEQQQALALKAMADARKYEMEQQAMGIKAVGEAEATAIKAKAVAEAEGIDKKAEAMKKYGEAAIIEMYMNTLPQVAKELSAPLSNIDSITMYGSDNTTQLIAEGNKNLDQLMDIAEKKLGLDIAELINSFRKEK